MTIRLHKAAALVALLMMAGACGGSDDATSDTTTGKDTATATDTQSGQDGSVGADTLKTGDVDDKGQGLKLKLKGSGYTPHSGQKMYLADVNGNAACDGPDLAKDHGWREVVSNVSADVLLDVTHNLNFQAGVCDSF